MPHRILYQLASSPTSRALEAQQGVIMIMIAIACLLTPDTIALGAFKYLLSLGWTAMLFTGVMFITGSARIWALWVNGRGKPYTGRVRAFTALVGAVVWLQMSYSLFILTKDTYTLSIGTGVWATMGFFELYSCYRAGIDVWSRHEDVATLPQDWALQLKELNEAERRQDARKSA